MLIRPARPDDASAVSSIYEHYALHTAITFAEHAPSSAHYAAQIEKGVYPFYIAEDAGEVIGFAYAGSFRPHDAYRWDTEATIYLRPGHNGKGTGTRLMQALLNALRQQGFLTVYSCITVPNEASVRLHQKCGFTALGEFPATGFKHGRWHSVLWMQCRLNACEGQPEETKPFGDIGI